MSELLWSLMLLATVVVFGLLLSTILRKTERIERQIKPLSDDRCPVDALDRGMTPVEAAVWHVWGERCVGFEPKCPTCKAWAEFDRVKKVANEITVLRAEVERFRGVLRDARDSVEAWASYASDYSRDKHDLAGDLARIDSALAIEPTGDNHE